MVLWSTTVGGSGTGCFRRTCRLVSYLPTFPPYVAQPFDAPNLGRTALVHPAWATLLSRRRLPARSLCGGSRRLRPANACRRNTSEPPRPSSTAAWPSNRQPGRCASKIRKFFQAALHCAAALDPRCEQQLHPCPMLGRKAFFSFPRPGCRARARTRCRARAELGAAQTPLHALPLSELAAMCS